MISNIIDKDELSDNYEIISRKVKVMENALDVLSETEKLILDRFYIHRIPKCAECLADELHCEIANVYKLKDKAVKRVARCLSGIAEL